MSDPNLPYELAVYADEEALSDALDSGNEGGDSRNIVLPARDRNGSPFLASLGEVGGDCTEVVYVGVNETGWPTGKIACGECGAEGPSTWRPAFPITTLVLAEASRA